MHRFQSTYLLIFVLMTCLIFSCETEKEKAIRTFNLENHLSNYEHLKEKIAAKQIAFKNDQSISQSAKLNLAKKYLGEILIDSIFTYWEGTKWDFNGTTQKPRSGDIACGYFVTTCMRDIGIDINRVKMAQDVSSTMIKKYCQKGSIKRFSKIEQLDKYMKSIDNNEVLIIGLDFHTGFIYKKDGKAYFCHSFYKDRKGVVRERILESMSLTESKSYMIGRLTNNPELLKNWVK